MPIGSIGIGRVNCSLVREALGRMNGKTGQASVSQTSSLLNSFTCLLLSLLDVVHDDVPHIIILIHHWLILIVSFNLAAANVVCCIFHMHFRQT